jgi:hypothetical protein
VSGAIRGGRRRRSEANTETGINLAEVNVIDIWRGGGTPIAGREGALSLGLQGNDLTCFS